MKKQFNYNADTGVSTCTIYDKGRIFVGRAYCDPRDEDMKSKFVGSFIAETRANVLFLKHIRKNELRPQLVILEHIMDSFNHNTHCSKDSYEYKMINRQIKAIKNDIDTTTQEIIYQETYLKTYIKEKEQLYIKIRKGKNH